MRTNPLLGTTIATILLADDRGAIKFVLSDGADIVARCYGECSSRTWIEDLINHEAAIGSEVIKAEDIALPEEFHQKTVTEHYEQEMTYYGFAIETAKGRFTIAYRNSSNDGSYVGSLEWPGDHYYGGAHGEYMSTENWHTMRVGCESEATAAERL